jgi:hypothetical protein
VHCVILVLLSCRWLVIDLQLQHCALQPMCSGVCSCTRPSNNNFRYIYLLSCLTLGCCSLHDALAGTPCPNKTQNSAKTSKVLHCKSKSFLHVSVAPVATYIHARASSVPTRLQAASILWQHTWHAAAAFHQHHMLTAGFTLLLSARSNLRSNGRAVRKAMRHNRQQTSRDGPLPHACTLTSSSCRAIF